MIELRDYQKSAVKQLKERLMEMLDLQSDRQKLVFKAPTGSGKTVMASALLDQLNMDLLSSCRDIAFIWIAPNKLHVQSYLSMRNFFSETRTLRPVMFNEVDPLEGLESGEILFLNWESINKDNAVIIRDNEQNRNLYTLVHNTKQRQIPIVVIIDEEHMYTGSNAKKSELVLQHISAKIELRISATPITGGVPLVEVPREKVVAEGMIKKSIILNPHLKGSDDASLSLNQQLIETALHKRDALARMYREFCINPLLLIQLPNDTKDSLSADEKQLKDEIISYLDVKKNITTTNGKLAVWLSGERENVNGIERRDSIVDVMLFKQAIALGWDCPRAAVLLIFRDLKSKTFTIQTVGRILRMPELHHYTNDALNYGYVYTNLSADQVEVVKDDMGYISQISAHQRPGIENVNLPSVYQDFRKTPHVLKSSFKRIFKEVVSAAWELPQTGLFDATGNWDDLKPADDDAGEFSFSENRRKAHLHGIRVDVQKILVRVPRDLVLSGEEEVVSPDDRARFCRTMNELTTAFNHFCRKNVGAFEPQQSADMIRSAIFEFFEEGLRLDENQAIKVVLYYQNQPTFKSYITTAEERYEKQVYAKEEERRDAASYHKFVWSLPEVRVYNSEVSHSCETEIFRHALVPYWEENSSSEPERRFSRMIDQSTETVAWWYKNANKGHMHFAVPYTDHLGKLSCFYVDYIILLKNGVVCLFDTKTQGSDPDAPAKHNALLKYMEEQNKAGGRRLTGGVIIPQDDYQNWYYSELPIDNTNNLDGWTRLDLNKLNTQAR